MSNGRTPFHAKISVAFPTESWEQIIAMAHDMNEPIAETIRSLVKIGLTRCGDDSAAPTAPEEWVIRINLADADGVQADEWLDYIAEKMLARDPGFSGLVHMMKEQPL